MTNRTIAVDIGATHLRVADFADDGALLHRDQGATPRGSGAGAIVSAVVGMIRKLASDDAELGGICIGVPAPVDVEDDGYVEEASNLPELKGCRLLPLFREHLAGPLFVRNDAALATLGEHRRGAGRGVQNMVYITISTGIGGGIIVDGHLVSGAGGFYAGEVGELLVPNPTGDPMAPVILETVGSGNAIAKAALRALNEGEESVLRAELSKPDGISSRTVADAARGGDPMALRILQRAAAYIGFGIVDVMHLVNPEKIVLGGGVMASYDLIRPVIERTIEQFAMKSSQDNVEVVPGELGDNAGLFGAAAFLAERIS